MKKQGLPPKLSEFIKGLGFPGFTSWPYKKTLWVLARYCEIRQAELSDHWILPDVEGLLEVMCDLEKTYNGVKVQDKIDFKELFRLRPARLLIDFKSDIWFLPLLAERKPVSWQKLVHAYNSLIFYMRDEKKYDLHIKNFIARMKQFEENFAPDKIYEPSRVDYEDPFHPGRKINIAKKLYPSIACTTPCMETFIAQKRSSPQIGFGLESSYKNKKVKSRDVVVDAHTKYLKDKDKHILYAAGWSVSGAFDDGEV